MPIRLVCVIFFLFFTYCAYADFQDDDTGGSFEKHENFSAEFPPNVISQEVVTQNSSEVETISGTYHYDLPSHVMTNEKVIIVDPNLHAWGAYSASGKLIRAGRASAGAKWCEDIGRPCKTQAGVFRIYSLGDSDCVSSKYPIDEGGAPMPYCMYFNGAEGLHGSNNVVDGNISHGCVRLRVSDAEWIRYNFAGKGTKVIIKPY